MRSSAFSFNFRIRNLFGQLALVLEVCLARNSPRIVMFKQSRTGSTWLADILNSNLQLGWFQHDAQECSSNSSGLLRILRHMLIQGGCRCEQSCRVVNNKSNQGCLNGHRTHDIGFSINRYLEPLIREQGYAKLCHFATYMSSTWFEQIQFGMLFLTCEPTIYQSYVGRTS